MGKRKSSTRKPAKKIKQTLDTQFTCLFCNHEKSVICTLDKRNLLGELHCKICGQSFQTAINGLSQAVDVYSDWIDACEDLAEEAEKNGGEVGYGGESADEEVEGRSRKEDVYSDEEEQVEDQRRSYAPTSSRDIVDSDDDDY